MSQDAHHLKEVLLPLSDVLLLIGIVNSSSQEELSLDCLDKIWKTCEEWEFPNNPLGNNESYEREFSALRSKHFADGWPLLEDTLQTVQARLNLLFDKLILHHNFQHRNQMRQCKYHLHLQ